MNAQRVMWIVISSVLGLAVLVSACAPIAASPMTMVDMQAEIDAAVQSTVIAMQVDEQMAAEKEAEPQAEAEEQQQEPTATEVPPTAPPPSPTPTATATSAPPEPTNTPQPTATLIAEFSESSSLVISADVNTNCRLGPSRQYRVDGYLLTNAESTVHGQDSGKDWWYIANPTKDDKYCWVWRETTDVQGNTDNLPVIEPPPLPKKKDYVYYGYYGCYGKYDYGCPIRMIYDDGWNKKWYGYDIKSCGCQNWQVCYKYKPANCYKTYVDDCCKVKIKKVCKQYCFAKCTIKQIKKGNCEPVCCKW